VIRFQAKPPSQQETQLQRAATCRDHSETRQPDILESERRAALVWPLTIWGFERFNRRRYLDAFYRTIDGEYARFSKLPYSLEQRKLIKGRVLASIRTIAAFSAWYSVAWSVVARSLVAGTILAWLSAIAAFVWFFQRATPDVGLVGGWLIGAGIIIIASRSVLALPRRWPRNAIVLVVAGAAFSTLSQHFAASASSWWQYGLVAGSLGAAVLCVVTLFGLVLGQAIYQRVTWCKINRFPEEEIIQTIAFLLGGIEDAGEVWRTPEERAQFSQTLEWIAQRCSQNLPSRYLDKRSTSDKPIADLAAECGEAFRARKALLAFPSTTTISDLGNFLWDALVKTSSSNWDGLERVAITAPATRRTRALGFLISAGAVVLPIAVAACVLLAVRGNPDFADFGRNVAITLCSLSFLNILSILNPKQFENQLTAASKLGDLIRPAT
jgi:hypothetical protein